MPHPPSQPSTVFGTSPRNRALTRTPRLNAIDYLESLSLALPAALRSLRSFECRRRCKPYMPSRTVPGQHAARQAKDSCRPKRDLHLFRSSVTYPKAADVQPQALSSAGVHIQRWQNRCRRLKVVSASAIPEVGLKVLKQALQRRGLGDWLFSPRSEHFAGIEVDRQTGCSRSFRVCSTRRSSFHGALSAPPSLSPFELAWMWRNYPSSTLDRWQAVPEQLKVARASTSHPMRAF